VCVWCMCVCECVCVCVIVCLRVHIVCVRMCTWVCVYSRMKRKKMNERKVVVFFKWHNSLISEGYHWNFDLISWCAYFYLNSYTPLGSILPTFYTKFLCSQIPKAQKDLINCIFMLLESAFIKASRKMLVKSTPGFMLPPMALPLTKLSLQAQKLLRTVSRTSNKVAI